MQIGLYVVLTDASMPVTTLAQAIEARGFDSMWVPEHSHIPTTGSTPYPGRGPVTKDFARAHSIRSLRSPPRRVSRRR